MRSANHELAALERRYAREVFAGMSYHEALSWYAGLWAEARLLNPDFPNTATWMHDIKPDLAVARALNGLPPAP